MSADWKKLTRDADLKISEGAIRIACGGQRAHKVYVDDSFDDAIRLWSVVVPRRLAPQNAAVEVWKMNRYRELVGFKVAEHGRVIGECWVPKDELSADEWKTYVFTLARACDRLEYLWTGRDVE